MFQLVGMLAAKTKDRSSILGPTWWRERTNQLFSDLYTCACVHIHTK